MSKARDNVDKLNEVTIQEMDFLAGVTSDIQAQIDLIPTVAAHEAAANPHAQYLTQAEGDSLYETSGTFSSGIATHAALASGVHGISAYGATLVDDADAATARSTLGLGTIATATAPAGAVVGTSDTQTLTGKTIVVASNTITTAASGNLTATSLNAALAELQTDIDGRLPNSGAVSMPGATSFGFSAGAGGSVTQLTSKATAVTLNKPCGQIITHDASLAASAVVTFTVTNSTVAAADAIICNVANSNGASYIVSAFNMGAGVFTISLRNMGGVALAQAVPINFVVFKGASS